MRAICGDKCALHGYLLTWNCSRGTPTKSGNMERRGDKYGIADDSTQYPSHRSAFNLELSAGTYTSECGAVGKTASVCGAEQGIESPVKTINTSPVRVIKH